MNAEGTKRLALIKSLVEEQGADGDKRWIIDQLVVSEATCQSLREQSSRWEAQALEAGVRIAELEALFALQQTRMAEATHMWQEATGKRDVLPDLGDLLAWLMARPAALGAQVRRYQEKADALFRYTSAKPPKTDAMMAILTELSLEGEARAALAEPQGYPEMPEFDLDKARQECLDAASEPQEGKDA